MTTLTRSRVQAAIADAPKNSDATYFRRVLRCPPVHEMTKRIDIIVKPEHVRDGKALDPGACAMCLAEADQYPEHLGAWFLPHSVLIFKADGIHKGKPAKSCKTVEAANDTGKNKPPSMVIASILPIPYSETRGGQRKRRRLEKEAQTVDVHAHTRRPPGSAPPPDEKPKRIYRKGIGTTYAGIRTSKKWKDIVDPWLRDPPNKQTKEQR